MRFAAHHITCPSRATKPWHQRGVFPSPVFLRESKNQKKMVSSKQKQVACRDSIVAKRCTSLFQSCSKIRAGTLSGNLGSHERGQACRWVVLHCCLWSALVNSCTAFASRHTDFVALFLTRKQGLLNTPRGLIRGLTGWF